MQSNRFINLQEPEEDIVFTSSNPIKKALKKLREIQALEHKESLSHEEQIKVSEKSKWESYLPGYEPKLTFTNTSSTKKHKPNKTKDDIERRQRAIQHRHELRDEARRNEFRLLEQQKIQEIETQTEHYRQHKSRTTKDLEKEWTFSLTHMYNNDILRTFRFMSIKYHPDKCDGHNDALQKHLGYLRDKSL
jgi:hypothetical protein